MGTKGKDAVEYAPCPLCRTTEHLLEEEVMPRVDGGMFEIICTNPEHLGWIISAYGKTRKEVRRIWSSRSCNHENEINIAKRVWELGLIENIRKAKRYVEKGCILVDGEVITDPEAMILKTSEVIRRKAK